MLGDLVTNALTHTPPPRTLPIRTARPSGPECTSTAYSNLG
ncbi:hypothetical protein [Nonomuraea cavernae]|nr:hypothetical protein [Nonomuraea cavernae]